jgi:hypothetical protein
MRKMEDQITEIPDFNNLRLTTMTLIVELEGNIAVMPAFQLLPVTRVQIRKNRNTSKCKLPFYPIPGAILSMRHRVGKVGITRGIIRTSAKSYFKNSVTIDISISHKTINMKLSSKKIQMCGATSIEDGLEAVGYLMDHLIKIQKILNRFKRNPQMRDKVVKWLTNASKGREILRAIIYKGPLTEKELEEKNIMADIPDEDKECVYDHLLLRPAIIPEDIDNDMAMFLMSLIDDFQFHTDYINKVLFVVKLDRIISDVVTITDINEVMVNYNYNLGFPVDRFLLNEYIHGVNGFYSRFDITVENNVTIELEHTPDKLSVARQKKKKIPRITYLVYGSGAVTQSGPGRKAVKIAYYKFMTTISEIRDLIEYKV